MKKLALLIGFLLAPILAFSQPTPAQGVGRIVAGTNVTISPASGTGGAVTINAAGGSGSPGGSNGDIQYNNSGAFGGITPGTGVVTALGNTVNASGGIVTYGGTFAGTLTSATGLPISTGVAGLGTGVATFLATPSFANLNTALTGDDAAGLAASNAFTGINSFAGATVKPANALGALAIDVTKGVNTKTVAADSTFTFSGTPATANTWFSLLVTNSDSSAHTLTIPSSFAVGIGTITTTIIPASGKLLLTWQYDGSAYNLYGASPLQNVANGYAVLNSSGYLALAQGGLGIGSGTSGGVPYFSASSTVASSAALAANAIVIGGGAGAAPATTTTGTGVLTALGINTGSAGAFQVNNASGASLTSLTAANISAGALADGMTATTQAASDNDTSIATTAFSNTAAKATLLGSYGSPDTTAGSITWSSAVYEVWTNTTTTYALPAASTYAGKAVIFYVVGTNAITIDPNGSEVIVRDGTAQTGGVTMTLTGAAGNYVCLVCDGTRWITLGFKGTLAAGS